MKVDLSPIRSKCGAVPNAQHKTADEAHNLLLRTIRQLNSIGIYDGSTMTAVYGRRLARVEAEAAAEAAAEAKRQRALFLAKAA